MLKTKKSLFLILSLLILLVLGCLCQKLFLNRQPQFVLPLAEENNETETIQATVNIFNGLTTTTASIELFPNSTAFDFLRAMAEQQSWQLETKDYGEMGLLVESVGGVANGQDNKYWMYYVNGAQPQVSASKQIINNNDIIDFKFEASAW